MAARQQETQTVQIDLPVLHAAQLEVARSAARYRVACCGRRFGKSEMAIALGFFEALVRKELVWWCVPTHTNAIQAWNKLLFYARQVPNIKISLDEKEITFPEGGSIRVVSMQVYNNVRGAGIGFLVFDECAFADEEAWTNVLEPMLLDKMGRALFISTPNGFNWFYRMYQRGVKASAQHESFHFTSWDNPYLPREGLEQLRAGMSAQVYAQEVMAEFVESAGAVFTGIDEVLQSPVTEVPDALGVYVMGVDWGRKHDFTAVSVWEATSRREVQLERFNEVGFEVQSQRIRQMSEKWGVSYILAEENGIGIPNVERLQAMELPVEPFKMTASSKKPVIEALRLAIDQATVALLDIPVATDELRAYQTLTTQTGLIKYSAPPGGFDDTVIARALALRACGSNVGDIIEFEW